MCSWMAVKYCSGWVRVVAALLNLLYNSIYQVTAIKGCPLGCSGRGELDSCLSDSEPYIIQPSPYHSLTHSRTLINVIHKFGLNPAQCITHAHTCRHTQIHCVFDMCHTSHRCTDVQIWCNLSCFSFLVTCRDTSNAFLLCPYFKYLPSPLHFSLVRRKLPFSPPYSNLWAKPLWEPAQVAVVKYSRA